MLRRSEPEWRFFLESLALAYSFTCLFAARGQRWGGREMQGWSIPVCSLYQSIALSVDENETGVPAR